MMDSKTNIIRYKPLQGHFKTVYKKEENKIGQLNKSLSLPDLSMNITYILKWLSKVRKQEYSEGEWKMRTANRGLSPGDE